jgi:acyl-CoA synthetase (AMP-forming)/AMP-acid ligase II
MRGARRRATLPGAPPRRARPPAVEGPPARIPRSYNLALPCLERARATPDARAIRIDGRDVSYAALARRAGAVAAWLRRALPEEPARVGIFEIEAYAGVLGAARS